MTPSNNTESDRDTSSNKKTPNSTTHGDHNRISPLVKPFGGTASAASISPLTLALITDQRRRSMATTAPTAVPNIFGRPMDPAPAPLVYINGGPGVGKEAVAESLAVLLGQDKSWLVDVRRIGRGDDDESENKGTVEGGESALPLITPEHPGYFGYYGDEEAALAAAEEQESSSRGGWYEGRRGGRRRSEPFPNILPDFFKPTNSNCQNDGNPRSLLPPSPPPCSEKKLARLLSQPGYSPRIGILPFCAFDTPTGHVAMKTFTAAAKLSGRLFIPIALNCEPAEQMRRAQSLQRQCGHKNNGRRIISMPTSSSTAPGAGGGGASMSASTETGTGTNAATISGRPSSNSFSFGGRSGDGKLASGSGGKFSSSIGDQPSGIEMGDPGDKKQRGKRELQVPPRQLPPACPVTPYITEGGEGTPSSSQGETTDSSKGYKLTVDITKSSAFDTALKIMELVKRLIAERDAEEQRRQELGPRGGQVSENSGSKGDADPDAETDESGGSGSSTMTTPLEGTGYEWKV